MRVTFFAIALLLQTAGAPDLSGTWTLDTYLSDNPEQVLASIRADLGQEASSLLSESTEAGRNARGRGRRAEPRRDQASSTAAEPTADEQRAIDAITAEIRYPPPTLTIVETASAVTLKDATGGSRTFQTNGKAEPQTFADTRANVTASWQGPQLVVAFDLGKGRTMTSTYSIVPTTHQLSLRVTIERAPNQPGPFEIRYIYDRASGG